MVLSIFRMLDSLKNVWIFTPPLCVLVGTVGNMLTLITVTSKSSKKNSFIVYLGALAVADTASLYFVVINSWLFYGFDIDIMLTGISCKVLAFMLYTCKMFSSLLVATLSTDRMVFLAHQTEIATLFAWVIKLHLTQVFSPRLKKYAKP